MQQGVAQEVALDLFLWIMGALFVGGLIVAFLA
jgi:hypothetical protein